MKNPFKSIGDKWRVGENSLTWGEAFQEACAPVCREDETEGGRGDGFMMG